MMLNELQNMIRDAARDFAQGKVLSGAEKRDQEGEFPHDLMIEMGRLGLMGMTVPEEWGGSGAGYLAMAVAIEEIAAADGALSTVMSVQNSLFCSALLRFGDGALKVRFLKPSARGEKLGAFGLTEAQAGSDAAAIRTIAKKDGGHYILNGGKQFITSGKHADLTLVFAVTDPEKGKKGMSAFVVPTDTPGYIVSRIEHKMGQNGSDTAQLVFENMRIPVHCLLGAEGEGYKIALANLEGGRIGIGAQSVGMARAAYEAALAYAKERRSFGKSLIEHQAVGFRLAEMATRLEAARLMVHHAASLRDENLPCLKEACMGKLFASEAAEWICRQAIQVLGGYGYLQDFPVERIYRDVRVCSIYEGTSDIQKIIISREIAKS
ncbi:MAG: acyl-CoA dehydrogenase family protein [Alphaproteobacteria bacterium]|nr:acyl-CoA dehydrogenase family protein [Alphaproteobacteria bacterium]